MSEIWKCQGVQRQGHEGVWRSQRLWPSGAPIEMEVLDQDEDPTVEVVDKDHPGGKRKAPDPVRIGRLAWAAVLADGRISRTRVGGEGEGEASKAMREGLRRQVAEAEERALDAEREASEAQEQLTAVREELAKAGDENRELRERLAGLEGAVPLHAPFAKTEPSPAPTEIKRGPRR